MSGWRDEKGNKAEEIMRPTLKEQLAWQERVDSMTDRELVEFLVRSGSFEFWLFRFSPFLWSLLTGNWFCVWCDKKHFRFSDRNCILKYHSSHQPEVSGNESL